MRNSDSLSAGSARGADRRVRSPAGRGPQRVERGATPVPRRLLVWAVSAALGGFAVGYNAGVVAGALLSVRGDFALSAFEQGALASVLPLGAMAGGLSTSRFADTWGRRGTLIAAAGVFIASSVLAAAAPSFAVLLAARAAAGVAVGAASSVVPLYLSEVAPAGVRGRLVTINQLMVTLGILVSYCVGLVFAGSGSWRAMFAAGAVPAAALMIGMLRAPETPVWLVAHDQPDRAREVIEQVADRREAERLIDHLTGAQPAPREMRVREVLRSAARPALMIGVTLAVLQQLSGINTIIYYGPTIMQRTGLSASNSMVSAVVIGLINVAATVVSFRLVDRLGRRPLLLLSLAGMVASLTLLGVSVELSLGTAASWLSLACIVGYIAAFAMGMGPVFWLLIAEIFPPGTRAAGASVSTAVNWLSNFAVGLMFLPLADAIGQAPTFWVFAAACVVATLFVARYVPETKGRDLTDLGARFGEGPRAGA
jgi:SP family galactose:H+ symporter-like MFS transporter